MTKLISIICPVYNEELSIPIFYERLSKILNSINDLQFEVIFTNNCSVDNSLNLILELRKVDYRIKVVTLSRNFGYQKSLLAGLSASKGDAVICIDVDCEDPPELIVRFIEFWRVGFDIVYGRRGLRPEPKILQFFRKIFYKLLKAVGDSPINLYMAEFSLFSADVRKVILSNRSTHPFIRNDIAFYGGKQKAIDYDRQPRVAGRSYYNIAGMVRFALTGLLTSSTFPLRFSFYLTPVFFFINIFSLILSDQMGQFYFRLLVIFDFMYIFMVLGFMCLYIARIYHDIVGRPKFIVDRTRTHL